MDDIRVIIVEDDPMVAEINRKYTEAVKGFAVVKMVRRGDEALEQVPRVRPDLVILDNYLPEKTGLEILNVLRRDEWPIDVIMITAADDAHTVTRAFRQGIIAYITKPFTFERYRSVLEAYRDFRFQTGKKKRLGQAEIDSLAARGSGRMNVELSKMPKNYNSQTRDLIINFLVGQHSAQSAEEIAVKAGLSRVTARRYLEYLVEQGQVRRTLDYLAVGRPVHRFHMQKSCLGAAKSRLTSITD
ncbi:MAG TPA: two-component system response regulator [Sporomusaceae bacterium]|jgi:two-component system response regulator DctR|uniref:response regulator n=1 Tax=Anaerospora sp. TaxID=1960278 RepID=UPI000EE255F5|nr:response regulator [Anaerospora sp.]HAK74506.1 two-component system response regulator [Sporomusaceae bacterium]